MPPRIKTFLLLLLLLLFNILLSSGKVEGVTDGVKPAYSLRKAVLQTKMRKLLLMDAVLDYDYPGPNPKHDPRKGKPGGGSGKNP